MLPVVLGAGCGWVVLHESVGHWLEGDFNLRCTSVFCGHMGVLFASDLCSVVVVGSIADRRVSVGIDVEGSAGQYYVLF
ncbi:metallopeptidase TldD-related protein, partial [Klebsiella pneumoniae]|uniref:metallopeptidase TldD-related protein n=1 Tax=Klebsiella pneumoniae TaxID=573 RepID=UPI00351D4DA6